LTLARLSCCAMRQSRRSESRGSHFRGLPAGHAAEAGGDGVEGGLIRQGWSVRWKRIQCQICLYRSLDMRY
jgi:hypothetical protein